ncbi:peptide ABC transporter substrate-binding protein [Lacticaseibacillus thailandensis]|nr:peptide ABC transporter substrate-binding protein [Lacticaseibacillus thailandensis]
MLTTLVGILAACGTGKTAQKQSTVTYMQTDVLQTMDPGRATDIISAQSLTDVYAGLLRWNHNRIEPDMAAKMPTVSKDQKTYTYTLRKGIKWSDGHPVTAGDFVYAWRRAANPKTKSQYAYIFSGIKNADAILAGEKAATTLGVRALSPTKLQVKLDRVMPYFNQMITLQTFMPLEKSVVTKAGSKFGTSNKTLTFNGPYRLHKWTGSENTWTETKNPRYWDAQHVTIKQIKYQVVKENNTAYNLYKDGKVDDITLTGNMATQVKHNKGYQIVKQPGTEYLVPNLKRVPAFRNEQVRQALSMALNRPEFIKQVLGDGSVPSTTVVPESMMYNAQGQDFATVAAKGVTNNRYDLKRARQLFKAGMQASGHSTLTFTILGEDTDRAKATLAYLQAALEKLSQDGAQLKVQTKSVPFKTRLALVQAGNFDMVADAWSADFPDAINFLEQFTGDGNDAVGGWHDARYDALLHASKTTDATNAQKRWQDLVAADQILAKTDGVIPLYQSGAVHLQNPRLRNVSVSPNSMIYWEWARVK